MQYCLEQRSATIGTADHFLYSICLRNDVAGEREECANENFTWTITQSKVQKTTFFTVNQILHFSDIFEFKYDEFR